MTILTRKLVIVSNATIMNRYANESCESAANIYNALQSKIGCTYLLYMYENLMTNEKFIYSSCWDWQDILIGKKLINNCPIFLAAFKFLEKRTRGHIFVPWYAAPAANKDEKRVCDFRSEFNIANGFGYAAKGYGVRESLAFGGDVKDKSFYKNFIETPSIFPDTLREMRLSILTDNYKQKMISKLVNVRQ